MVDINGALVEKINKVCTRRFAPRAAYAIQGATLAQEGKKCEADKVKVHA